MALLALRTYQSAVCYLHSVRRRQVQANPTDMLMVMSKSPVMMNLGCHMPGSGMTWEESKIIKLHSCLGEGTGDTGSSLMVVEGCMSHCW